jgi:Flp pilus assembly protein TadG
MSAPFHPSARERGIAAVELAFVLPVLVAIVFGITELGRAMYQYDALTKSVRSAARYLSVYDPADAGVRERAVNMAVCGAPSCGASDPVAPGLSGANVVIAYSATDASLSGVQTGQGTLDLVRVTIGAPGTPYAFASLVPFVVPRITFGPIVALMPAGSF